MAAVCQMSDFRPVSVSSPVLPQTSVQQTLHVPDMSKYPIATSCFSGHEMRGPHHHPRQITEKNWGVGLTG